MSTIQTLPPIECIECGEPIGESSVINHGQAFHASCLKLRPKMRVEVTRTITSHSQTVVYAHSLAEASMLAQVKPIEEFVGIGQPQVTHTPRQIAEPKRRGQS